MSEELLPLSEAVRALRAEIVTAAEAGKAETIRFGLGKIELEFQIVAKREGGSDGKIKFGVLGVGLEIAGSAKFSSEQVHKVKVTLNPVQINRDGAEEEIEISRKPRTTKKR
jgi:hypothetical protein